MRTQLVTIQTDTYPIDGAFHEPDEGEGGTKAAALYFHGNTINFYTGGARFLPPVLTQLGIAVLAFNRRGHDILTTRASRAAEGGAFQTTAEAVADNRYAAQWLGARGKGAYANPIVMGHSNGGMLSTRHVADHPNTPALVLLSAGRGSVRQDTSGGTENLFAAGKLDVLTQQAHDMVAAGRGREHDVHAGLVVRDQRRKFSGSYRQCARHHRARAADQMPGARDTWRQGRPRPLSRRGICSGVRRAVRSEHRCQLRPFLQ